MKEGYVISALLSDTDKEMHQSQLLHLIRNLTQEQTWIPDAGYKYFQGQRVIS